MKQIINRIINIATYLLLLVGLYLVFLDCKEFAKIDIDLYSTRNKLYIFVFFGLRQIYNLSFLVISYFLQTLKRR